jgi:lysylphosphatidylglycerol synthetase-like protein (DUF2156 family)
MRAEGIEPPRPLGHEHLKLARLPGSATPANRRKKRRYQGIVTAMADTVLVHPNRDKPEAKATKAVVILLLVASAALILIVTIGGWSELQGMEIVSFGYAIVYLVMAYFVSRWNRGVLPVAAGLAVLFAVVAAVAGPAWFERDKAGFNDPALDPSILGLLTLILVPVQLLLVAFAMRGFQQQWNTEIEVRRDEADRYGPDARGEPQTA